MNAIAPNAYAGLPPLDAPASYICVIRDIDRDSYRMEAAARPRQLIEAILHQSDSRFGIELVAILQTDDLAATETALYERHQARLGCDWLELDAYQLHELRRSILQIDAYPSHYLALRRGIHAKQETHANPNSRHRRLDNSYLRGTSESEGFRRAYSRSSSGPDRSQWKHRRSRQPIPERRYGARSLRRNYDMSRYHDAERRSISEKAGESFEDIFVNHPGIVIGAILLLTLVGLLVVGPMSRF